MINSKLLRIIPGLSLIFLLLALLISWVVVKNIHLFPIKEVQIQATYQHVDKVTIQQTITPYVNGGFFNINAAAIKQHLLELPWVYAVSINRVWPNKLNIKITEQQVVARWNTNAALNSDLQIFTPLVGNLPNDVPLLVGPDNKLLEVLQHYQQMNQLLAPLGLTITQLGLNAMGSWQFLLNNNISVILGNIDVMQRFVNFIKVYPKIIVATNGKIKQIDLRYAHGFAIEWENGKKNSKKRSR